MTPFIRSALAALPPQQCFLSGTHVVYRQAGNGPPLLLIHGWGGSSRYWLNTMKSLADIRSLYALDLPGFGDSPPQLAMASAERMAELVIAFADNLGLDHFEVNGHSFGAGVAAYLAARWPSRVTRVVLTCFSLPRTEFERAVLVQAHHKLEISLALWQPWWILWQPWLQLWQPLATLQWSTPPLPQVMAARFFHRVPNDQQLLQEGMRDFIRMDLRTALEAATSIGDPAIFMALQAINVPTLLVGGRQDLIMPPSGVEVAAQTVPHGRLAWIEQCGHVPMIEQPAAYHQAVRDFLI